MRARTGTAQLPLHGGRAPAWLFSRMVQLSRQIAIHVVEEFGPEEMLRRLSDPFWFQAFGCVLGFDWHSSGVTTTVTGALKEGLKGLGGDLRLHAGGGKGAASRKTPDEIAVACDRIGLQSVTAFKDSRNSRWTGFSSGAGKRQDFGASAGRRTTSSTRTLRQPTVSRTCR